jgi:hypothetical protein
MALCCTVPRGLGRYHCKCGANFTVLPDTLTPLKNPWQLCNNHPYMSCFVYLCRALIIAQAPCFFTGATIEINNFRHAHRDPGGPGQFCGNVFSRPEFFLLNKAKQKIEQAATAGQTNGKPR